MGELIRFPKCSPHEPAPWSEQQLQRGNDDRWYEYRMSKCVHCGRPLVAFAPDFPCSEFAFTRRHVAFWLIGKHGEDGRNVSVMPWGTETFDQRMRRTVSEGRADA